MTVSLTISLSLVYNIPCWLQVPIDINMGEKVLALWPPDGRWYDGYVIGFQNSKLLVRYFDQKERTLLRHQVSRFIHTNTKLRIAVVD